jgi:predicted amidohydrolase
LRAAVYQSALAGLTPAERIERLATVVAHADAELVLCPELFLSGYAVGDELRRRAEPADGPSAHQVAKLARANRKAIGYGFPERTDDALYNAALVIGPDGSPLAHHRKLVLPPGFERDYFTPGAGPTLFSLGELRVGLLICYDAEFPEAARALAEAGAQVILVPTALGARWSVVAEKVIPARAFENGVYLLYANHAGTEGKVTYLGGSCIAAPDGHDLARAGASETVLVATLDRSSVEHAQSRLPYIRDVVDLRARLTNR